MRFPEDEAALGMEQDPPADDPVWQAVVGYFDAPSELVARIKIREHREPMASMAAALLSQDGDIGIDGMSPLGDARVRLLARCFEIGIGMAFFEAYQNGNLPFRLEQPEDEIVAGDDLGLQPTPELRELLIRFLTEAQAAQSTNSAAALDRTISAIESVLGSRDFGVQGESFRNRFLNQAAIHRLERFRRTGDARDADRAIAHYRQVITDDYRPGMAHYYGNIGIVYQQKFRRFANLADLESAIAAHIEAIELTPVNSPHLHARMGNLGNSLWYRYQATHDYDDFQRAYDPLDVAVLVAPLDAPERPGHLNNLADVLTHHADIAARAGRVERAQESAGRAVELARESVKTTLADSADLPRHLATLGYALMIKGAIGAALSDGKLAADIADEAIDAVSRSIALTSPGTHDLVVREGLLADLMAIKATTASGQNVRSHDEISQYFRRSVSSGRQADPAATVRRAQEWGRWAAKTGQWAEAAEAYAAAIGEMATVFGAQEVRAHKETSLRQAQDLPGEAAFACAQAGELSAAVRLLEQGRAMLLTEALSRQAVTGDLLRDAGEAELAEHYESVQSELARLELDVATDPLRLSELDFAFSHVSDNRHRIADKSRELAELTARAREVLGIGTMFPAQR